MMPEGPENNAGGADKLLDGTPERALTRAVTLEDPQGSPSQGSDQSAVAVGKAGTWQTSRGLPLDRRG
jgi:hypothetical protein